eukprot:6906220-Lingulodinium_polyedra.AAC.1
MRQAIRDIQETLRTHDNGMIDMSNELHEVRRGLECLNDDVREISDGYGASGGKGGMWQGGDGKGK